MASNSLSRHLVFRGSNWARSASESQHPEKWKGLLALWSPYLVREDPGGSITDLFRGEFPLAQTAVDSADWGVRGKYSGVDFVAADEFARTTSTIVSSYPFTMVIFARRSGIGSSFDYWLSMANSGANNEHCSILFNTTPNLVQAQFRNSGQNASVNSSLNPGTNWFTAAFSHPSATEHTIFAGGHQGGTSTTSVTMPTLDRTAMGQLPNNVGGAAEGVVGIAALYSRAWTLREYMAFNADPLAMFLPHRSAVGGVVAAAAQLPYQPWMQRAPILAQ